MNQSFDKDGAQFAWDATSLSLASECPRKYFYKMIEGWAPKTISPHLTFGGVYASACELYHRSRADGLDHDNALRESVRDALIRTWELEYEDGSWLVIHENEKHPKGIAATSNGRPWQSEHNTKTRENLIRTIVWYLEEFKDDACKTIILDNGKPAVELSFAIPVDDGFILSGHLDRLVEYSGDPYVTDQKTTGSTITRQYFEHFSPDIQMSQYTFAGKVGFGIPVKGVIIDGAQIAVGFSRFERGFVFRDAASLQEWYDETMALITRTRDYTLSGFFPKNTTACFAFGGCQFRPICSRSPEVRKQFLKADFVQKPIWDPLKKR